ncbi:MAG: amidohydrolase family protein, partial [Deinococcus sp.]|nr:amidohydrolase family protein [Deinococcus sp.]
LIITHNLGHHGKERGFAQNIIDGALRTIEHAFQSVQMAKKAGVTIATGSDPDVDECVADEIEMLVKAGFTPLEAIEAATRVPMEVLRLAHQLGTIEVGKIADFIILDGDPIRDLGALRRVEYVVQGGQVVKEPGHPVTVMAT